MCFRNGLDRGSWWLCIGLVCCLYTFFFFAHSLDAIDRRLSSVTLPGHLNYLSVEVPLHLFVLFSVAWSVFDKVLFCVAFYGI